MRMNNADRLETHGSLFLPSNSGHEIKFVTIFRITLSEVFVVSQYYFKQNIFERCEIHILAINFKLEEMS